MADNHRPTSYTPDKLHAIGQSFYNALPGSMKPDGSTWAKYSPLIGICP